MTDLTNTKVGDKLIISHGFNSAEIITVTRTTKTQVILWDATLHPEWQSRWGGEVGLRHAHPTTPEEIAEIREESRRHNCMTTILRTTRSELDKLPTERLEKIMELLA